VSIWIQRGIELISNTKPDSISAGRKAVSKAIWLATNWFLVAPEMKRPWPNAGIMNAETISSRASGEPRNGTPKAVTARIVQIKAELRPSGNRGWTLVAMNSAMLTGVAISASIVPRSHSRAITRAVSRVPMMVSTIAIEPGTRK